MDIPNTGLIEKLKGDVFYRETIIDSFCTGITLSSSIRDLLEYVIDNKLHLFDRYDFMGALYDGENDTIELILPTIRLVWSKFFVNYPSIFQSKLDKLELYQLMFNIDEFIDYLIDMFIKSKSLLLNFENLDRTSETLTLIVNNYVAMIVKRALESKDVKREIRDIKINKIL